MKTKTILLVAGVVVIGFLGFKYMKKVKAQKEFNIQQQAAIMNQKNQVKQLAETPGGLSAAIDLAKTPVSTPSSQSGIAPIFKSAYGGRGLI